MSMESVDEVAVLTMNRGDEIGRRAGIFYVGQMLGVLTAGLITSGASAHLDGVAGLAGWRSVDLHLIMNHFNR